MSSEASAIRDFETKQKKTAITGEEADNFFAWAEVEHRKNTMSLDEAAALLGVDMDEALLMIKQGTLCASVDASTHEWLVKTGCVRAQLAETVPLAPDFNEDPFSDYDNVDTLFLKPFVMTAEVQESLNHMFEAHSQSEPVPLFTTPGALDVAPSNFEAVEPEVKNEPIAWPKPAPVMQVPYITAVEPVVRPQSPATDSVAPIEETKVNEDKTEDKAFDRAAITAKNIEALMDSLDFASVRLEGSMYRIGFLEAQVQSMESQLDLMNDYRNRAAQAIIKDRENDILRDKIAHLEMKHENLQNQFENMEENFVQANVLLHRIEQTWWFRLCSWLFRFKYDEPEQA